MVWPRRSPSFCDSAAEDVGGAARQEDHQADRLVRPGLGVGGGGQQREAASRRVASSFMPAIIGTADSKGKANSALATIKLCFRMRHEQHPPPEDLRRRRRRGLVRRRGLAVALTQAAVGQQMRALETELRRPLFARQGKSVVLNDAGRELLPQVRSLLASTSRCSRRRPRPMPWQARCTWARWCRGAPLIQATLALKARHAALDLHVSAAKSIELVERVQSGAGRGHRRARTGRAPELVWASLYAEPMVLLAPRKLEESSARVVLQQQPFIRFDPTSTPGGWWSARCGGCA